MKKVKLFMGSLIIIALLIFGYNFNKYMEKDLKEILGINPNKITTITMTDPDSESESLGSTTNKEKIEEFINYLSKFKYKRKSEDAINIQKLYPSRDGIKTSTIFIYEDEKVAFIIPCGKEAMINNKAFKVIDGEIDFDFIIKFYDSIKNVK